MFLAAVVFIFRQSVFSHLQLLDAVHNGGVRELLGMVFESSKESPARVGACDSGEFFVSAQKAAELLNLAPLEEGNSSHEHGESVLSEEWLPFLTLPSQFIGHPAHGAFVLLKHFQRSTLGELASPTLPLFFQPTSKKRVVVAMSRERRVSARDLALAFLGPPGTEDGPVVAEFELKFAGPGLAVFVESVNRMLVNVNPAQPATGEPILMRVQGLEDLLEVVILDEE